MKFESSGIKGTWVIERKQSVTDGQTDRRTDGQTDKAKTIYLPQRGDISIIKMLCLYILVRMVYILHLNHI